MYALLLPTVRFKDTNKCSFSDKLLLCVRENDRHVTLKTKNYSLCLPEWVQHSVYPVLTFINSFSSEVILIVYINFYKRRCT